MSGYGGNKSGGGGGQADMQKHMDVGMSGAQNPGYKDVSGQGMGGLMQMMQQGGAPQQQQGQFDMQSLMQRMMRGG